MDDSRIVRESIIAGISRINSKVSISEAATKKKAIELLERQKPDLVIMDIHLRNSNGIGVLKFIKEFYPLVKVIVLTNETLPVYRRTCLDLGADYFFDKSSDFEQVLSLINSDESKLN